MKSDRLFLFRYLSVIELYDRIVRLKMQAEDGKMRETFSQYKFKKSHISKSIVSRPLPDVGCWVSDVGCFFLAKSGQL